MTKGTKRSSPGADEEKTPLSNVELSNEDAKKLTQIQRDLAHAELILERQAQATLRPVYERRREITKIIPNFWPLALTNHSLVAYHAQHSADQTALSYLEDIWIEKDTKEHRCFTIEFYFKENQFFFDRVLKKEYKYVPPPSAQNDAPEQDGITAAMIDFNWDRDVAISACKINWKEPDKALTKVYPRETENEEVSEPGSFFNLFEYEGDPNEVGVTIANEVFPEAIEYFLGNVNDGEEDSEDEDSEDDDDDDAEIDLEKPRSKKRKV